MNKLLTQIHNWKYENYCPLEVVDGDDSSSLTLQWETSVHKVLESCEDKYGKQIEYLFQQVITSHQKELFSLIEEYIAGGYKKVMSEQTIHTINLIVKEYFYKEDFWGDVESLIRENREDLLERDVSCVEVVDLRGEYLTREYF